MKTEKGKKPTAGMTVQTRLRAGANCAGKGNMAASNKCADEYGQRMDTWSESANFKEFLACENSC